MQRLFRFVRRFFPLIEPDAQEHIQQSSPLQRVIRFVRRFFIWFLIIVAALWSLGFYEIGRSAVYRENPGLSGQQQAAEMLKKVGELIQLPINEAPTVATINDAASAKKEQPFLVNAENGDVLIVYPNAQTALLYRPSQNKLIAVGPVTSSGAASQSVQQPAPVIPNPTASTSSTNEITNTQTNR